MVTRPEVLAIVPARGGSKSITRKNIRPFAGHPLLAYSVAAGLQAETVSRVIVSTDDESFAEIAKHYGADVPFMRPQEIATDDALDHSVFLHALEWLDTNEDYRPEIVVQLRPTSPIRPRGCVDEAVNMLLASPEADSVRGVVPSGQNPYKMWRLTDESGMEPLLQTDFDEPFNMPRQHLPETYWQTGHIDAIRTRTILEKGSMSGDVILPLVLDPAYTVDIDTIRDWELAEWQLLKGELDAVRPGKSPRPLPEKVELVVLDFDGVLTDNRVWVDAEGHELIAANRGDGLGLELLREEGIDVVVLSRETNPVVEARCRKLGLPVIQGLSDKTKALVQWMKEHGTDAARVVYLGNDVNDTPCFPLVGCAGVVADAHPQARTQADFVLSKRGGHGAVRELCDILILRMRE
jgi:N-acylneuraminate cytidylyltransferase